MSQNMMLVCTRITMASQAGWPRPEITIERSDRSGEASVHPLVLGGLGLLSESYGGAVPLGLMLTGEADRWFEFVAPPDVSEKEALALLQATIKDTVRARVPAAVPLPIGEPLRLPGFEGKIFHVWLLPMKPRGSEGRSEFVVVRHGLLSWSGTVVKAVCIHDGDSGLLIGRVLFDSPSPRMAKGKVYEAIVGELQCYVATGAFRVGLTEESAAAEFVDDEEWLL